MATELLWAPMKTPDGLFIPGPHGTSISSEVYPGISSSVGFVISGGEVLLIDTGYRTPANYPAGVLSTICNILDQGNLRLKYIVQTHGHFDHIGNTRYLKDRYGAEVVCHQLDRMIIENPLLISQADYMESVGGDADTVATDLNLDQALAVFPAEHVVRDHWNFPVEVDRTVQDGDVLEVGDIAVQVVHTPGHTPGHLSLFNPSTQSLYISDLMYWPSPSAPYPIGNVDHQVASIKKCLDLDAEYLFPGHELPRCGRQDTRDYLVDLLTKQQQLEQRLLLVLSRDGALTASELHAESFIVKERFDYPSDDGRWAKSINCVYGHLRSLTQAGRVTRVVRQDGQVAWQVTDSARVPAEQTSARGAYLHFDRRRQRDPQDHLR